MATDFVGFDPYRIIEIVIGLGKHFGDVVDLSVWIHATSKIHKGQPLASCHLNLRQSKSLFVVTLIAELDPSQTDMP